MSAKDRLAALSPEQRELVELLRRKRAAAKRPAGPEPIPRRGEGNEWPLTFDQERLWFLWVLDPQATAYNIDTSTRMEGDLDVAALSAALNEIVRRHEAWRTSFPAVDGRPVQVIAPALTLTPRIVDLRDAPAGEREELARAIQREEARHPFDLERVPLVRALLIRMGERDQICMITVHHIVTDWVSFQLFWRELAALYVVYSTGRPAAEAPLPALPEIPLQFADFALWQREQLAGERLERLVEFWTAELAGAPHVLELPFDRPRPPMQTTRGAERWVEVPGPVAAALRTVAREVGATPFMAVMAAFKALLFRITGQEKVIVGSPNANRNRVELEPMLGFFLTQLVFATDGAGDPDFRELLARVRRTSLAAYAHQDLPFGKLLDAIRPERDNSRPPLVQANFLLLDAEYTPMELPGMVIRPIFLDDGNSRFDTTLGLWESSERIYGFFEYNLDLFDGATVARWAEGFEALAAAVVEDPGLRLSELPLLSAAARQQVLHEWVGEEKEEDLGWPSVPELFARQARQDPRALALAWGEEELTYGELARRAGGVAARLLALGIGREARVGICVERSPDVAVAMLGAWGAGAAWVPLDPAYPRERLALLMADAGLAAVVTRERLRGRLPRRQREMAVPVIVLEETGEADYIPAPAPADLAYVIYTSGTTGQPKGVMVEHHSLAGLLAGSRRAFGWERDERVLAVAPFSFDIFLFELWNPLATGGTCELLPVGPPLDIDRLLTGLGRATRFHAVPALMRQVVAALRDAARDGGRVSFPRLSALYTGGDAVPPELLAALADVLPGIERRVLYGPTEGTILATSHLDEGGDALAARPPLGRPLPGVEVRLVQANGALAPLGVAGEVWLGGVGVARGYLARPELQAKRFVERAVDGEMRRFYRTGDLARFRADGELEFLGRADDQVKVRGFRIEPAEVEAALDAHPEVAAAAVAAVPAREAAAGESGERRLIAYFVPRSEVEAWAGPGAARRVEELRAFLRDRLPEHLVPAALVPLAELPLTSHGKVDRKALPAPEAALAALAGEGEEPRDGREELLAEIWRSVLGLERVGVHDNFFQLGGDSILSIQVVARARRVGLALSPKQIFEHQTIAGQAAAAAAAEGAGPAPEQGPVAGEAPLTPVQRQFFAEPGTAPERFAQSVLLATRAGSEPLEMGRLAAALDRVEDHHDALRLRFVPDPEAPGGVRALHAPAVLATPEAQAEEWDGEEDRSWDGDGEVNGNGGGNGKGDDVPLLDVDLSALPAARREAALVTAAGSVPAALDLARGPLFVAARFRLAPGGSYPPGTPRVGAEATPLPPTLPPPARSDGILGAFAVAGDGSGAEDRQGLGVSLLTASAGASAASGGSSSAAAGDAPLTEVAASRSAAAATDSHVPSDARDLGGGSLLSVGGDRLLLAAHHLVVDGVSWRILLEDLEAAYRGEELPPKTTSWKRWAEGLAAYARLEAARSELAYWLSLATAEVPPLPFDEVSSSSAGSEGTATEPGSVTVALSPETTVALLKEAPEAYRTQINDLLLAALGRTLALWAARRGSHDARVLIELEGHGREEEAVPAADLSRTVGWFTTLFPVVLDLRGAEEEGRAIQAVKEMLRTVPRRGLGFGLLRWLGAAEDAERLAGLPRPEVSFNYLGQLDAAVGASSLLVPAGEEMAAELELRHRLEVDALVLGERFEARFAWRAGALERGEAEALAQGFRAELESLVAHCLEVRSRGEVGYTPSDFPLAGIDQAALEALLGRETGWEDVYPLAPLQGGMLFHGLYDRGSELYFEQLSCVLAGPLDAEAFARAWQRVVDRQPALRTAFLFREGGAPVQAVRRRVEMEWRLADWRDVRPEEVKRRWAAELAADRARGFELSRPPLMRLMLARTGEDEHRFAWSFHHLLFDGWCFGLLFSEVFALYEGLRGGAEPALAPARPFRDFLAWLAGRDVAAEEAWWRGALAGFGAATPVPFDRPAIGPGERAEDFREREVDLSPATAAALEALASRLRVTQNVLVQGAWALLLSRLSGERDVVFGSVVSGRPADLPGVESIVGLFLNTVPVRLAVPGEGEGVAGWLARLAAAQAELRSHEWTPLPRVQAWSEVPAGEPLFHSLVVFENYPIDPSLGQGVAGVAIREVEVSERTNYALTLAAVARGGMSLRLSFDRRFEPATALRLLGYLESLLVGMTADAGRPPEALPLLSEAERHQLAAEWAGRGEADPEGLPVFERVAREAVRRPGAEAVAGQGAALTFGELERGALAVAAALRAAGMGKGSVVGLCAPRTPALVAGLLGVWKAGAVLLPLDPSHPKERLAWLLADSGARAVLADAPVPAAAGVPVLSLTEALDSGGGEGAAGRAGANGSAVGPSDPAYVIYTSGTTGRPKGVVVEHGSLASVLAAARSELGWGDGDRMLSVAPFTFDIFFFEVLGPLAAGAACELLPLGTPPDLDLLVSALARVTRFHAVPALMRQVTEAAQRAGTGSFSGLRALYTGGDAVPPDLLADMVEVFPRAEVRVLYGPTEATIICASQRVSPGAPPARPPLGRPLASAVLRLEGPDGRPAPPGAAGELLVGGPGVARGYLGLPELTAERFVERGGRRFYRTGDLARWGAGGTLEFLGRADEQVKVRGVRIEPAEVEAALASHPAVARAAVAAPELPGGDRRLAAWLVPANGGLPPPEELRAFLAARLPEVMIPSLFQTVEELPLTLHGKVDRRALARRAPAISGEAGTPSALPRTAVEERLAGIWREVLAAERVGMDDDFFRLGGDSILCLQVVARARQAGLAITPRQVFEHPTVAALAAVAAPAMDLPAAEQGPVEGEALLTPIQRWFLASHVAEPHWLAQPVLLEVRQPVAQRQGGGGSGPGVGRSTRDGVPVGDGELGTPVPEAQATGSGKRGAGSAVSYREADLRPAASELGALLGRALAALADHHDALRLRFSRDAAGRWRASHAPPGVPVPFATLDLGALPERRRAAALEAAGEQLQSGFDLAHGPLFAAALFDLGAVGERSAGDGVQASAAGSSQRLLLAAHHLVVDAVSWRVLIEDLETALDQLAAGLPVRLREKTTSWQRWAEGLGERALSTELAAELPFWLALPEEAVRLPADSPGGEDDAGSVAAASVELSVEETAALLGPAHDAYRTRPEELLLAALARAVAAWLAERSTPDAGPSSLLVDLEGHGREDAAVPGSDLSRTVGWFTTVYPVALDLGAAAGDPAAAILDAKERLRAVPGRGLGWGLLRWMAGAETPETPARLAALPRAEIAFNFLGRVDAAFAGSSRFAPAAEAPGAAESPRARRAHRLEVNALVVGGRLRVDWLFGRKVFAPGSIERLAAAFGAALAELLAHCASAEAGGVSPSDFPLARLDTPALDALLAGAAAGLPGRRAADARRIEDVYPLAPLQAGMLFHGLYEPGSELYVEQLSCTLSGPLDARAFVAAFRTVIARHPALRTAFAWQGLPRPLQVVRRGVEMPWTFGDWRGEPDPEARFQRFLAADRARGFDLAHPPLLRAALFRTGEQEHRFAWTFHHMLFDGWCFSILFGEVFALYAAAVQGGEARLAPVRPFREYLAWLERREAADPGEVERFWRVALAGFSRPTPLPVDAPAAEAGEGREEVLQLEAGVAAALGELARGGGLTVNSLAQGAWGLLLSRYGGGRDVVFGTVVSGRPSDLPGVESIVGLFINTLPVRLDVEPRAALLPWLRDVQEGQLALRQREHAPLAEVQRWSDVPPGEALFGSLVVFENYPVDQALGDTTAGLAVSGVELVDRTDVPLSAVAIPLAGPLAGNGGAAGLELRLAHDGRTDPATARRLLGHWAALLAGFAAGPEASLGEIPLLSEAERHQLLVEWNDVPEPAPPAPTCLHRLVETQAAHTPAAPAVLGPGEALTYGELDRRANRLARYLGSRGAAPEVRVLVWVERSAQMAVAVLAVLKAGAAFVPVDPGTPAERVAALLEDAGAGGAPPLLLTEVPLAARLPMAAAAGRRVLLDAERAVFDAELPVPPASGTAAVGPGNLAYQIYTSGSTGVPKGVAVEHRSIAAYAWSTGKLYGLRPGDRMLHFASLSFDVGVEELFCPLVHGAAVVIDPGTAEEPARFLGRCRDRGITVLSLPTAYWHQVVAALDGADGAAPPLPPAVRLIITGGERALPERWMAWGRGAGARVRLLNGYGPTEATVAATAAEHPGPGAAVRREVPIGRPYPGVAAHVVGPELDLVPLGGLGELVLGGRGVARGYHARPEATAAVFVPDPYGEELGARGRSGDAPRLYRTGDLVRRRFDGSVEFAARADAQVKVRGYRVEPGEVESVLAAHPSVRDAAVVATEGPAGDMRLVAFAVPRAHGTDSEGLDRELTDHLARRLPAYLVPSAVVTLEALPLTSAGKVDRRALAELPAARGGEAPYVAPRNAVEQELAAIWRELLGVERAGVEDDFFALGGHSLLATRLASRLRGSFGVEVPLPAIFEHRRLGDLAQEVLRRRLAAGEGSAVDRMLEELEGLSDEEAMALLAREEGGLPAEEAS